MWVEDNAFEKIMGIFFEPPTVNVEIAAVTTWIPKSKPNLAHMHILSASGSAEGKNSRAMESRSLPMLISAVVKDSWLKLDYGQILKGCVSCCSKVLTLICFKRSFS